MKLSSKQKAAVKKAIKIARDYNGAVEVAGSGNEVHAQKRGGKIHWNIFDDNTGKIIAEGAVS